MNEAYIKPRKDEEPKYVWKKFIKAVKGFYRLLVDKGDEYGFFDEIKKISSDQNIDEKKVYAIENKLGKPITISEKKLRRHKRFKIFSDLLTEGTQMNSELKEYLLKFAIKTGVQVLPLACYCLKSCYDGNFKEALYSLHNLLYTLDIDPLEVIRKIK